VIDVYTRECLALEADKKLVADVLAASVGQDGWSTMPAIYWLVLTNGHLHRRLFGQMLQRIWAPPVPGG
jgi:hypothetical protein